MCGIVVLSSGDERQVELALSEIGHRGHDSKNVTCFAEVAVGHVLHAMVGTVPQPAVGKGKLLFNGEIYNWKQLCEEEGIECANDTALLLYLLDTYSIDAVRARIDGVYAYVYIRDNLITIERDLFGVKPLWYALDNGFSVASEKKALIALGLDARELHPRTTLQYDIVGKRVEKTVRPFTFDVSSAALIDVLRKAVAKRLPDNKRVGVLLSGIDSALIALLARDLGATVQLYVAGFPREDGSDAPDVLYARKFADEFDFPLEVISGELDEDRVAQIVRLIESSDVTKVETAIPIALCCERAREKGERVVLTGNGADELLCGFVRQQRGLNLEKEAVRALRRMFERSLYKDDVISMASTIEMRVPYLDPAVVRCGLANPSKERLYEIGRLLGISDALLQEKSHAPHYGSRSSHRLRKLAKGNVAAYLHELYPSNAKLCALVSSGKDSMYAMHLMQKRNYPIGVVGTIVSANQHSYMYHTPLVNFAGLQAESLGLPYIEEKTAGEKETELDALHLLLQRAVAEHQIEGVVSGAVYSDYQRSRIEQICEDLGLYVFAPLWHLDQESMVREIIDAGFEVVLSRVAADGLDKTWVGRQITHEMVDELKKLPGFNVAGEGGEYESLVLNGPGFSKQLKLKDFEINCEKDGSVGDVCELSAKGTLE